MESSISPTPSTATTEDSLTLVMTLDKSISVGSETPPKLLKIPNDKVTADSSAKDPQWPSLDDSTWGGMISHRFLLYWAINFIVTFI